MLEEHGFTPTEKSHSFHITYYKHKKSFELHFDILGVPSGKPGDTFHQLISDIFDRKYPKQDGNNTMFLPSISHHGIISLLHICSHLTYCGIGLRHLCDWAVFGESLTDELIISDLKQQLQSIGLWKLTVVLSIICEKYLGCRHRLLFEDGIYDMLADDLTEDILFSGNFGRKNANCGIEGHLITTNQHNAGKENNILKSFLDTLNRHTRFEFPVTKKFLYYCR